MTKHHVVPFVCGVVFAGLLQIAMGWWLNSGPGVVTTLLLLFAVAMIVARDKQQAVSLWLGVMTGMAVALVVSGAGTIWPIVLVVSGVLTGSTVLLAWFSRRMVTLNRGGRL